MANDNIPYMASEWLVGTIKAIVYIDMEIIINQKMQNNNVIL